MMTCRHVGQLRDRHLDGDLSPSLAAEVHAHLLQCPACQRQFELHRCVGEVITRDRSEPKLPVNFTSRVTAALSQLPRSSQTPIRLHTRRALRERFWRLTVSAAVPAAAAMLFLTLLIWPTNERSIPGGLVAGVSVRATEAVGVNDVADPALSAVNETVRAASSISRIQEIIVEQARQTGGESKHSAGAAKPEITLLNALLFPFNEAIEPATPHDADAAPKDDGVVRF
ncbi:MAG: zf-HC2 domain-containing protein [Phycisphaerae bacterium]|nr:zf-HC2 domain-containing protein [Phycisphaerae bacterium]